MSTLTVGLTGGLASGKSTLAGWLAEAGFTVVDADQLVADLYRSGGPGARAVVELFGEELLGADGAVDRARLGEHVFSDGLARRQLEQVIHPLVRNHFQDIAAAADGIAVLEATLLLEAGMASDFDHVVAVEAEPETRVARAMERGLSESDARARVAAQGSDIMRRGIADLVIENDADLAAFRQQADELIDQLRKMADQR